MTFSIVIPVWGREELAARVCHYYRRTQPEAVVVTVGDALEHSLGAHVHVLSDNEPLGHKFNDGVETAWSTFKADYVLVVGSDSFVHPDYFERIRMDKVRYPYYNPSGVFFAWPDLLVQNYTFRSGSGAAMSRILLDRCYGRPYKDDAANNLDAWPRRYAGCGGTRELVGEFVYEERGEENMWGREWVLGAPNSVVITDPAEIARVRSRFA